MAIATRRNNRFVKIPENSSHKLRTEDQCLPVRVDKGLGSRAGEIFSAQAPKSGMCFFVFALFLEHT